VSVSVILEQRINESIYDAYKRVEPRIKGREVIQLYRSPRTNRSRKNEIAATPLRRIFTLTPIFA